MDGSRQKELQIPATMNCAQQKELAIDVEKEATKPPESPESEPLSTTGYRRYFSVEVTNAHADVLLLTCCFVSGLVDSTVYNAFGTFVSMQTVSPPSLALCLQFSRRNAPNYEPILTSSHERATPFSSALGAPLPTPHPSPSDGPNLFSPSRASVSAVSASA